jgi:hypothetical protein
MLASLITIRPLNASTAQRFAVHLSSVGVRALNGIGGIRWEPAVTQAPALGQQFWNGDFEQGSDAGEINFTFNIAGLLKSYPEASEAVWMGAAVEVMVGPTGAAWPWPSQFLGKVSGFNNTAWPSISLTAKVDTEPFSANLLIKTYAGTGDAEGGADLKDQVKPLALGRPRNVEPVLINEVNSVYQFSGYGPIEAVEGLFERASAFPPSSGDAPNYAALVAADIAPGRWGTCLAEGLVRLGAPAAGVITGDIRGHVFGLGGAPRAAGVLVRAMASIAGVPESLLALRSLKKLDDEGATNSDIMVREQVTFLEAARRVILPCNRQVVISNRGVLVAMKPAFAALPSLTLHAQGRRTPLVFAVSEGATSLPYAKTTMAAERAWRTHTYDEIASYAPLVDRGNYDPAIVYREGNIVTMPGGSRWEFVSQTPQAGVTPGTNDTVWASLEGDTTYPDGTPIGDLQPAQPGADVTGDNTSKDTDAVGGVPASEVITALQQLDLDTTQALLDIAAAQGTIAGMQSQVAGLADDILAAEGTIETVSETLGTQGATITTLQTTADTQAGQLASLQTDLATTNANVALNASAITGLDSSVASLGSTVASQGASIIVAQQAITTLEGDAAILKTQVGAGGGNLLTNAEFAAGMAGWASSGGWAGATQFMRNGAAPDYQVAGTNNASVLQSNGQSDGYADYVQTIPVEGGKWYDTSAWYAAHRCTAQVYLQFIDASGNEVATASSGPLPEIAGGTQLSGWSRIGFKGQAPGNAARANLYLRKFGTHQGQANSWAWFLRPQVAETLAASASPRPYSPGDGRAVVETQAAALSTLDTQYASLSSVVATQGVTVSQQATAITTIENNVTTLFGRYAVGVDAGGRWTGLEINGTPTAGGVNIHADFFSVTKPGGGARLEYSGTALRLYAANDVAVIEMTV